MPLRRRGSPVRTRRDTCRTGLGTDLGQRLETLCLGAELLNIELLGGEAEIGLQLLILCLKRLNQLLTFRDQLLDLTRQFGVGVAGFSGQRRADALGDLVGAGPIEMPSAASA